MRIIKLKINTTDLKFLTEIVTTGFSDFDKKYVNRSENMVIAASESSMTRTGTSQMNMVVLKIDGDHTKVDVIGAAGGETRANISWGSESAFVNDMAIRLNYHCDEEHISVSKID